MVSVLRADGSESSRFQAFESGFTGGVRADVGELDGDQATVGVAAARDTGVVKPLTAIFAFEESFRGGVRVAVGNVASRAGGPAQIVVGAGEGGGPRVRTLDIDGNPEPNNPLADFFTYESSFRGGVQVAAGELDGLAADGDDLLAAAGTEGGPRVRALRPDGAVLAAYFAFRSDFRGGANVAVTPGPAGPPVASGRTPSPSTPPRGTLHRTPRPARRRVRAARAGRRSAAGAGPWGRPAWAAGSATPPGRRRAAWWPPPGGRWPPP